MPDVLVVVLVGLAMAVGIAGTVLPVLPGLLLVWAAALVYGIVDGFGAVGWTAFVLITLIGATGFALGLVLPHRAAGTSGAARTSVWFSFAVGIVGFFVIPVVGLPLGAIVGLFVAEWWRTRRVDQAWSSTIATTKGFGLGALVQVAAGLAMAFVWLVWVVL
jgi:uncharacterized protein